MFCYYVYLQQACKDKKYVHLLTFFVKSKLLSLLYITLLIYNAIHIHITSMKKCFWLFLPFLAFSCTTKNNDLKNQHLASDWSSYNWISEASSYCVENIITDTNLTTVQDVEDSIKAYLSAVFDTHCFEYPIPEVMSDLEISFYKEVGHLLSLYSISSDTLREKLYELKEHDNFDELSFDEQERAVVFLQTIIGISQAYEIMGNFSICKQPDRINYHSMEGDSRYERQLNNCMRYQMDGHLETTIGTLIFVQGLPFTALSDVVICNEEIICGYWSHVK